MHKCSLVVFKDCSLEEDELQETSGSPEEKFPAFSSSSSGASGLCPRHLPATRDVLPTFTLHYFIHMRKVTQTMMLGSRASIICTF